MRFGRMGRGFGNLSPVSSRAAEIRLNANTVAEDAAVGTVVGTLSVVNATGTPTFTLDDDADGLFVLDGAALEVADALEAGDYEITVSVEGTTPDPDPKTFTIFVTEVVSDGDISMDFSTSANSQLLALLDDPF